MCIGTPQIWWYSIGLCELSIFAGLCLSLIEDESRATWCVPVIVSFRGSSGGRDWLTNLSILLRDVPEDWKVEADDAELHRVRRDSLSQSGKQTTNRNVPQSSVPL